MKQTRFHKHTHSCLYLEPDLDQMAPYWESGILRPTILLTFLLNCANDFTITTIAKYTIFWWCQNSSFLAGFSQNSMVFALLLCYKLPCSLLNISCFLSSLILTRWKSPSYLFPFFFSFLSFYINIDKSLGSRYFLILKKGQRVARTQMVRNLGVNLQEDIVLRVTRSL